MRCLKPNDEKRADKLETHVLERQLVASGLVQAVQASRAGFSDHLPPAHLVTQFGETGIFLFKPAPWRIPIRPPRCYLLKHDCIE